MFCPKCGAPNEEDDEFCGNCGATLRPGDLPKDPTKAVVDPSATESEAVQAAGVEAEAKAGTENWAGLSQNQPAPAPVPAGVPQLLPPPPPPPPASRSGAAQATPAIATSGLAIAALVMGIGGLTILPLVGSVLAIIFGYMARRDIRQRPGELTGEGMAMAGIVMGWIAVGLAILGVLLGIGIGVCGLCGTLGSGNFQ